MKLLICIYLALGGIVLGSPYPVAEDVARLKQVLGDDWKITSTEDSIQIESTFDVWLVNLVSRLSLPQLPEFSNTVTRRQLDAEGKSQHYIVQLRYGPVISREEFEKRVVARKRYSDILTYGASGKTEYGQAWVKFREISIPRYCDLDYSIDRVLPDSPFGQFYPPSAVAKIGALKELLDAVLHSRANPYD